MSDLEYLPVSIGPSLTPVDALVQLFEQTLRGAKASPDRIDVILQEATAAISALRREVTLRRKAQPIALLPWQMRKVRDFVEDNLHAALPVDSMADAVRLSRGHFSRAFTASFGCPPHAYLQQRRLERAKTLIRTTEESLAIIATACGFSDQSHLSRLFRRCLGETPSDWRRRQSIPLFPPNRLTRPLA
ncbi:helix-turn-helix transcriptional regulator [Acidisoma cellulosilytica]|uniref:Helix-turn-helix transcriptional regulator n=1 Tax=Acidisoma cellulosilyticum TaxID=2802395 RepID=A0A963Z5Z6_9PROT|nr:AraC family transcriptional regulator [Acidisoma cellulosilyticum]MCB8882680.1 helix-turn-helix transcriptional regulator [Acidisoma cellulosilyticum]